MKSACEHALAAATSCAPNRSELDSTQYAPSLQFHPLVVVIVSHLTLTFVQHNTKQLIQMADLLLALVELGTSGFTSCDDEQRRIDARQESQDVVAGLHRRKVKK